MPPVEDNNSSVRDEDVQLSQPSSSHTLLALIGVVVVLVSGALGVYAYVEKIGPFASRAARDAPYTQENLLSGVLAASMGIRRASFDVSGDMFVAPRDPGARSVDSYGADLEGYTEVFEYLSSDFAVNFNSSSQYDWSGGNTDWRFQIGGEGDFGDLTYKIDVEAMRTGGVYYVRINNFPSLFIGYFEPLKGQWLALDPDKESTSNNPYLFIPGPEDLQELENEYGEAIEDFFRFLEIAARIADEEGLFVVGSPVHTEVGDGGRYTYDLKIHKNAVVPFYKRLFTELDRAEADAETNGVVGALFQDAYQENLGDLESTEFQGLLAYFEDNVRASLVVDADGLPRNFIYSHRYVPEESAPQFAGKQVQITASLKVSDINEKVRIVPPANARDFEDAFSELIPQASNDVTPSENTVRLPNPLEQLALPPFVRDRFFMPDGE